MDTPRPDFSGARWFKSTRSLANTECVEAAMVPGFVGVRDSKLGEASPVLAFPATEWSAFTAHVKAGELTH